jgi:hypothetical protein
MNTNVASLRTTGMMLRRALSPPDPLVHRHQRRGGRTMQHN